MTSSTGSAAPLDTVVLDLDGTLVDSVYVHVLAWRAAFRDVGLDVPAARLHRAIGLGGDRLVAHVTDDTVEHAVGDAVRERHPHHLVARLHEITATEGAGDLLQALHQRGLRLVVATSGDREMSDRLLDLVPGRTLLEQTISGSDAGQSKPAGDLAAEALRAVGATNAVMLGDATWDARTAAEVGLPCIGLLSGGLTEAELRDAGCAEVHDSPAHLVARLDASLLGRGAR
ncbi:HAD family hydrolase [Nocardioides sp.]|uniref:HAD family hydrolase n=1 Tax=Nocardioides sp. TaxID=35761 RepID=UPI00286B41FB|nr:HAD family hydrolase [Nocardioides sp.]